MPITRKYMVQVERRIVEVYSIEAVSPITAAMELGAILTSADKTRCRVAIRELSMKVGQPQVAVESAGPEGELADGKEDDDGDDHDEANGPAVDGATVELSSADTGVAAGGHGEIVPLAPAAQPPKR